MNAIKKPQKKLLLYPMILFVISACNQNDRAADAYGNFEADQVTISAQNAGKIIHLNLNEGDEVREHQVVGLIDTIQLHYKIEQLQAQYNAIQARKPGIAAQIDVLREQKSNLEAELERFQRLKSEGAATEKQVDDLSYQVDVLEKQINQIMAQNSPLINEMQAVTAQIRQIKLQMDDAVIRAPIDGTVLLKIMEPKEFTGLGNPLFIMANLDSLVLRAFVKGIQLDEITLGRQVEVWIDKNDNEYHKLPGQVFWIASEAEFTPKVIQTRDERVDLVYAIKIIVPNQNGILKIGMPGEVHFNKTQNDQG